MKPYVYLLLLLLAGRAWGSPGRIVSVEGSKIYMHCEGIGDPTVFLESGASRTSDDWTQVLEALASRTRVCAYDRIGLGKSAPGPLPRNGLMDVQTLHELVKAAGFSSPVVIAGHSYGALIARIFAHNYPSEIAGLVLIDSPLENYPTPNYSHPQRYPIDWQATMDQLRSVTTLGKIPLVVVTAGKLYPSTKDDDPKRWWMLQANLARMSSNSRQMIAENSDHSVPLHDPKTIVNGILWVLDQQTIAPKR